MPHEKAVTIIVEGKGQHFDPDIVDAFVRVQDAFREIARRYADTDEDLASKQSQLERIAVPVTAGI
jgi:putative two-component system response regulator